MISPPTLEVRTLRKEYPAGDEVLAVLKDVTLTIHPGELVAIVGQSGSGKSTLMNILGCLDRATSGEYLVGGRSVKKLSPDELAELRREHFGFIFQRYHLLGDLSALSNVEVPAVYSGVPIAERHSRANELLTRLGLKDRTHHRPGQLSGGQQQRVSIARALMNGGQIIFADEPTGALDSASGVEVLQILKELHQKGHTVVIVTHDRDLASHCHRIIEIRDGIILSDTAQNQPVFDSPSSIDASELLSQPLSSGAWFGRFTEAFKMSVLAMRAHKLRTFLTMLGIIIGIASVVSVVALGEGSKQKVLEQISSIGTNTLEIMGGRGFGDMRSGSVRTLTVMDADALARQDYIDSVTPIVSTSKTIKFGSTAATGSIQGVGEQYFRVKGLTIAEGQLFTGDDVASYAQKAVIDQNTLNTLFPNQTGSVIGQTIILGSTPVQVIGILKTSSSGFGMNSSSNNIYVPYTSVISRILGTSTLRSITVRIKDDVDSSVAEAGVVDLLTKRHGKKDFFIINTDQIRETITATTQTLTILISAIAVISLIVGGIGVMNIMLVSVTERTSEIGVRMAVGARQSDILQQFLTEAILVCLIGGFLGILSALSFGYVFAQFSTDFRLIFSGSTIAAAFGVSTIIGLVFGFLPALNAARLDPVTALARD